jgi:hypothetical protein
MHGILYSTIAVVTCAVLIFVWGLLRIRKGNAQASDAIRKVRPEEIDRLVAEGKEGLAKAYGIEIDLADREAAARVLDGLFADQTKLKNAFERDGFYWRFVLPVGALIGEYIRIHGNGAWKQDPAGLSMEFPVKEGTVTCYPFDKVLKQINSGDKGDLYAYLVAFSTFSSLK